MQVLAPLRSSRTNLLALAILASACVIGASGCRRSQPDALSPEAEQEMAKAMAEVRRSHIEGNVPPPTQFASLMKRDLTTYFKLSTGRAVSVEYEMLRQDPTQSGLSFPRYYVWVRVLERNKLLTEGAARVAAQDKTRFNVTDFLSKAGLRKNPSRISEVFPEALVPAIQARLR